MKRPDFIPENATPFQINQITEAIAVQAALETSIAKRALGEHRMIANDRASILKSMLEEAGRYCAHLMNAKFEAMLGGVPKKATVILPGGGTGVVIGFRPTFQPTHLVVEMPNGTTRMVLPEDVLVVKDSK